MLPDSLQRLLSHGRQIATWPPCPRSDRLLSATPTLSFSYPFPHAWVGKILWRKKWHPTPVLLPGESHGQRSMVGYSPWGCKESDTTEQLHFHFPPPLAPASCPYYYDDVLIFIWSLPEARGIFVSQPGMEPVAPALEVQSLNHWTTRDVPLLLAHAQPHGPSDFCTLSASRAVYTLFSSRMFS